MAVDGAGLSALRLTRPRVSGSGRRTVRLTTGWAASVTPRLVWALATVALVATVAVGATLGRDWWTARQLAQANASALAAGRQLAVNFATIDYRHVDQDTALVRSGATGPFLTSYASSLAQLKKVLVANRSVSTVERAEAGLVSGDLDSARVIVGIVAPTSNTAIPQGEKKTYRIRLDLQRAGDSWKVAGLDFVG